MRSRVTFVVSYDISKFLSDKVGCWVMDQF